MVLTVDAQSKGVPINTIYGGFGVPTFDSKSHSGDPQTGVGRGLSGKQTTPQRVETLKLWISKPPVKGVHVSPVTGLAFRATLGPGNDRVLGVTTR